MPPLIGITPCRLLPDYVESVRRAGGEPCVLQINADASLKALDGEVLQGNSRHHQAAGQTATSYRVTATAPDGVIEAIERPESRFCLAVQWHPENFWRTGEFRAIFEEFVKACER